MTVLRTRHKLIAIALAALLLALPVLPAFAADPEPVITAEITAAGASLQGKTALEAREIISSAFAAPMFDPLPVVADGHAFTLDADSALSLDVTASVDAAFAATEATALAPVFVVDAPAVTTFVTALAKKVDHAAVNSKRIVSHKSFRISASSEGAKTDQASAVATITAALVTEAAGSGAATVTVPVTVLKPKITRANIGKTIVVVLGHFRVRLYKGTKLEKSYRCAIGMRAYPTPRGVFKVIAKSAAPTWRNPYSRWSRGMPSHIDPGFYNPLGLRALYLNAPGIRIHGTSKTYSMGHAASHGCIRLTNHDVVDIYPRVKVDTPVYIIK